MITFLALSPSLDVTTLVRTLEVGGISRPYRSVRVAGGKALNAARVAARLGAEVRVLALLGGATGDHVASLIVRSAPSIDLRIEPVDGDTRTCTSIAADDMEGMTELYEPSPSVKDDAVVHSVIAAAETGSWVAISGSIPAGIDLERLAAGLASAAARGVRVAVDTHGRALTALLASRPAVVKVNRSEAAELLGVDSSIPLRELVDGIATRTGGMVVVTDGVEGQSAMIPDARGLIEVSPDPQRGRYPVGSGDSAFGALLAALDRRMEPADALREGAAAGSANAAVPGAGEFSIAEFEAARGRIAVQWNGER